MKINGPNKPPVLILGGSENALSVARGFGKLGIKVYASVSDQRNILYSKYCTQSFPFSNKNKVADYWQNLLLDGNQSSVNGSVILPCNDDAVEFCALNRNKLKENYILDDSVPEIHLSLLDKKKTLQKAKSLNIHIPSFWDCRNKADLEHIKSEIKFPAIIKPIHSHLFQKQYDGRKFFSANSIEELEHYLDIILQTDLEFFISELIPGPDSMLCSYFAYFDSNSNPLFQFTKRVIRRYPKNQGPGCYHITEWIEEVAELGLRFFKGINFKGMGNIEFKRDVRDGHLKVIESNPRITAVQELIRLSGIDPSVIIYNHLIGLPLPNTNFYTQNLRFWYPVRDFAAYRELKRKSEISFWQWVKSLLHRQYLPFFKLSDPLPTIIPFLIKVKNKILKTS